MSIQLPGTRRVYRVGGSLFRVWVDDPAASAELLKNGEWVYTPLPSGSIVGSPAAQELSDAEVRALEADPSAAPIPE